MDQAGTLVFAYSGCSRR